MRAVLFALTIFLSAALSFTVQPLVGKRLLPLLGGTPAVWNTCLVFFQGALLAGYLYAHRTSASPPGRQARVHWLVLLLPLAAFGLGVALAGGPVPVAAALLPTNQDNPVLPLLAVLFLAVGVPFAVLSATAPLLQRWYGDRPGTYALYAASNAGSLLGLLGYPFLVEPWLPLAAQEWAWAGASAGCLGLIGLCGLLVDEGRAEGAVEEGAPAEQAAPETPAWEELVWVGLGAVPAALLTSVSAVVTSEVAPVPLLWVVPLALYLVSFIVVFAGWSEKAQEGVYRWSVPMVVFVVLALVTRAAEPFWLVAALHLVAFFGLCLVCHGELVLRRPPAGRLTAFYLCLSSGGVLGGAAAALVAPLVFSRLGFLEYPVALLLATLVRPRGMRREGADGLHWSDFALAGGVGLLAVWLIWLAPTIFGPPTPGGGSLDLTRALRVGFQYGPPLVASFALVWRRWRFLMALGAVFLASNADTSLWERVLYTERNFFGTLRVTRDEKFVRLWHGATQHGQQAADAEGKPTPLLYYHPTGPIGRLLGALPKERRRRVGAVGLGCGALAAYARKGETWTFFEIDPAVVRVARDMGHFTYLETCEGDWEVVLGDARRSLEGREDQFDVLVLDAFSSDAIPVHLLTREALALYLGRLKEDGVLAFHVSNRYLDLPPLLARLGEEKGLVVLWDHDSVSPEEIRKTGKSPSVWVVMARTEGALGVLKQSVANRVGWQPVKRRAGPVWTDQYSNLLGVWKGEE